MLSSQKLTLLAIIVGHFGTLCVATTFPLPRCEHIRPRWHMRHRLCTPRRMPKIDACFIGERFCSEFLDFRDCLLPQFKCLGDGRCIPRSFYCNGIRNCNDGSDEWGCVTASSDSTTTSTMVSESVEDTSSYIITTTTILRDNEEKTTSVILPESEKNTSSSTTIGITSSSTTTSTMLPDSESNAAILSSTTSTESNTAIPSSTTTSTESNTAIPSSTTSTESNTAISSSATSTRLPDSQLNTAPSTSTTSTMFPNSESNTALSSSATTKIMIPDSEANTSHSSFVTDSTMLPESEEKTSYPTTNSIFSDSRVMQPCPDDPCMQNAECVVVGNQYRCKCPSSFIGKLCEVQLGTEQVSHEYIVAIVILMTLVILCLAVVSVGVYRYKRLSAWKSNDMTSRTLSQLTLTSNAVE